MRRALWRWGTPSSGGAMESSSSPRPASRTVLWPPEVRRSESLTSAAATALELRLCPEDGRVYSREEFAEVCTEAYGEEEVQRYWQEECSLLADHPVGRFVLHGANSSRGGGEASDFRKAGRHWWRAPGSHHCSGKTKERLVHNLCLSGLIRSETVLKAMLEVDRRHYVPSANAVAEAVYADVPQVLGQQSTISAPHVHAQCLELLAPRLHPGASALDVGCGSGYMAAAMARMVTCGGHRGHVVAIDYLDYLVEVSIQNVSKADQDLLASAALEFHRGDGWLGWAAGAPYDAIHVGAAAVRVPEALLLQLRPGGRLVVPVGASGLEAPQQLTQVDRLEGNGGFRESRICGVRFVPLVVLGTQAAAQMCEDEYEVVA